jgi:TIR domain
MQTLIVCHARADESAARQLADFLDINCTFPSLQKPVVFESGDDLLEATEQALSADIAVVLLSPEAVPGTWPRAQWEDVFVRQATEFQTSLVFLLLRPCKFPEVLRRRMFFDCSASLVNGLRDFRRWLLKTSPLQQTIPAELPARLRETVISSGELDQLQTQLADQPGIMHDVPRSTAIEFAHAHEEDFESVFWVDCGMRSLAGVLGQTGNLLGLPLPGSAAQNQNKLTAFCAQRRLLFVFEDLATGDREAVTFGGKSSVLFTFAGAAERQARPLDELLTLFAAGEDGRCFSALGEARAHLRSLAKASDADSSAALNTLGAAVFALLKRHNRLAEADEVLGFLIENAFAEGDRTAVRRWDWERSWIRESWGERARPRTRLGGDSSEPAQLSFDLE